jgi:hypothetical protein
VLWPTPLMQRPLGSQGTCIVGSCGFFENVARRILLCNLALNITTHGRLRNT